jgi:hypothetical protein
MKRRHADGTEATIQPAADVLEGHGQVDSARSVFSAIGNVHRQ